MNELTNEQYHADTSRISKSGLDLIRKSPAHYYAAYLDPNRKPRQDTEAFKVGTAIHCAILEPDQFKKRYLVAPKIDRRTREGKEAGAQLEELLAGGNLILLNHDDYEMCQRIGEKVNEHPVASHLLSSGKAEHSVFWTDPETGAKCKARYDFLSDTGFITDLKSTQDASPDGFGRSAFKFRYHVQGRFYYDGHLYSTGKPPRGFAFIAVEKEPPYAVAVYYADEKVLQLGLDEYVPDLQKYVECKNSNQWPAYEQVIKPLTLPAWAFRKL